MTILSKTIKLKLKELHEKYPDIPVPVVQIAKDLGIKIYETTDFSQAESGSIRKEDGNYVIYINKSEPDTRKRFTIAHEIGHYLMHLDYLNAGNEMITTVKQPIGLQRPSGQTALTEDLKEKEVEANQFAGELLMPEEKFKECFSKVYLIDEIANKFDVSASAVTVRANKLLGEFIL